MKIVSEAIQSSITNTAVTVTALLLAAAPVAFARNHGAKASQQPATVIAHITVPGSPANEMRLQERDGKQYLYMVRNSGRGFTVVDVTRPSQPSVIKRVAWPDGLSAGGLQLVSATLGLAEGSNARPVSVRSEASTETVELLDLSDPANPTTVQKFMGVTSLLTDEGHGLVYLTNAEGLWVVKSRPEKHELHRCTSDDMSAAMPMCE
jgi:hypothetical protein